MFNILNCKSALQVLYLGAQLTGIYAKKYEHTMHPIINSGIFIVFSSNVRSHGNNWWKAVV
jgi:hypothetical protein